MPFFTNTGLTKPKIPTKTKKSHSKKIDTNIFKLGNPRLHPRQF